MVIGEGAEAQIYLENILGLEMVVKVRQRKEYRIPEIDEPMRRRRTRKEAGLMIVASKAGINVPHVIAVGKFSIYMEKIGGKLLKDIQNSKTYMEKVGKELARMHDSGIVHGDYTPANIMISGNETTIIDFGLADMSLDPEQKAVDLLLMKRSVTRGMYAHFEHAYVNASRNGTAVKKQLAETERRGRYQSRTLS